MPTDGELVARFVVEITESRDREALEKFFRREESAHAYALADLDTPFWPNVRAFTASCGGEIVAVALLLDALGVPLLYAVAPPEDAPTRELLDIIAAEIPTPCVATLPLGVANALGWDFTSAGVFLKMRQMRLTSAVASAERVDFSEAQRLDSSDLDELQDFLECRAYAEREGGFFQPYMLELGPYCAIRHDREMVAVGGVHVVSDRYGVAGLGNIVTHPDFRGRGYASAITRALCTELIPRIPMIALNVRCDNAPAVRCYTRVGFEPVLRYEEGWIGANT